MLVVARCHAAVETRPEEPEEDGAWKQQRASRPASHTLTYCLSSEKPRRGCEMSRSAGATRPLSPPEKLGVIYVAGLRYVTVAVRYCGVAEFVGVVTR